MKITRVHAWPITLQVRPEFFITSSAGSHAISRYVIVGVETADGLTGWGEATVVPQWSGETQAGARELILEYFAPLLHGRDPREIRPLTAAMDFVVDNTFAKAAVEMALWDICGKAAGLPLYDLLGGPKNPEFVPIKFSIGLREPKAAAALAAAKVREGFQAIKVKVGPDPERDFQRVAAVREAVGPKTQLTIDVNGGWSIDQTIREAPRYEELAVAYVEQPTPRHDIEAMAVARKAIRLPVMADESVFAPWQARAVIAKRAADLISIYPGKHGGVLRALEIAGEAEASGIGCHIGSNLEWDLGTAAMCHLARACGNVRATQYPVDILGPLYYSTHPRQAIVFADGHAHVPAGPGLGLDLQPEEIEALTTAGETPPRAFSTP